jgi:hypothetical protein
VCVCMYVCLCVCVVGRCMFSQKVFVCVWVEVECGVCVWVEA